ncbi:hypothetical protein QQS21_008459 [Conoideocrella luteorostrata]|uniref:Uncharacterized protein n=1 Tax=Conoideocrella luteorostrata TaxID=1105319 RepID=A0AAJ0CJ06_9HYPO|nr:hypothetical protein QQS21_008459 [Conoideocrella luteorostrata]
MSTRPRSPSPSGGESSIRPKRAFELPSPIDSLEEFASDLKKTVKKENSVPKLTQWAEWLKSNLPQYIGEIDIVANWKTGSATVIFVLPIEIWLALPDNGACSFVSYHYMWDSADARRRHAAAVKPQEQQQQQPLQEEQAPLPRMRHGNVPRPSQPDRNNCYVDTRAVRERLRGLWAQGRNSGRKCLRL